MAIPKAEFIGKDIGGAKELLKYRWFQDTAGSTTRSPRVVTHPAETSGAGRSRLASCGSAGRGSRDRQAARKPGAACVSGRGRYGRSPGPAGAGGRGSARAGAGRCTRGALSAVGCTPGVRREPGGDAARSGWSGRRGRRPHPDHPPSASPGAPPPGPGLPLSRLRPPVRPGASHPSLGARRPDHALEPRAALSPAPPRGPRGGLPDGSTSGRRAQGLRLHSRAAIPGWLGERLDVGWAIDVVHPLAG